MVGDEDVIFALPDAIKYSLNSNDTCFYTDVTNSIADDFIQDMTHKRPFKESFDDPQEEQAPSLLQTDEVEARTHKKHWKVVTQVKRGKNKPFLMEVILESMQLVRSLFSLTLDLSTILETLTLGMGSIPIRNPLTCAHQVH